MSLQFAQPNGNALAPLTNSNKLAHQMSYSAGAGALESDRLHFLQYSIAASATTTLDLNAGVLVDLNGTSITFARLKGLMVTLDDSLGASSASSILVNGAASNVICNFTATIKKGCAAGFDDNTAGGFPLTNSTADKIVITNNDSVNPAVVTLALWGSAA